MTTAPPSMATAWASGRAETVLSAFTAVGLVGPYEFQLVAAAARADPTATDGALLALALVARATRLGHVCLALDQISRQVAASGAEDGAPSIPEVPAVGAWTRELEASALVATPGTSRMAPLRPMVWDGRHLYLQRYWCHETTVADLVTLRGGASPDDRGPTTSAEEIDAVIAEVFGSGGSEVGPDLQSVAARRALGQRISVISGGPGTGKTFTIAGTLVAARRLYLRRGVVLRAALAAPTGKAASRMGDALAARVADLADRGLADPTDADELTASTPTTIHRLLGAYGGSGFRHHRGNPLPHDLVIIDETSMVSLPLLARLFEAMRPTAHLVLVGDPFQLSSIEAGTVMADLAGPPPGTPLTGNAPLDGRVTELRTGHRFGPGSSTARLATAIRDGDADAAIELLGSGDPEVHWVTPDAPAALAEVRALLTTAARDAVTEAVAGNSVGALWAAQRVKLLAAVRRGPNGLFEWSELIGASARRSLPVGLRDGWPRLGTPVMVTGNDPVNQLANGDVGVVVASVGGREVVLAEGENLRRLSPARLDQWEPWWAMTIHKSQGSEFPHAVVALPVTDSPILTRELLYTAVTRGKPEVTIVGSEEVVRTAIARPVAHASGLRDRLWPGR